MRKKIYILVIVIFIICLTLLIINFNKLKFNLDITSVYSIEYSFAGYHVNDDIVGETTDKDEISEIIMYLNSLSLPEVFIKNKGATEWIGFKDKNGNLIDGYAYGSGLIWVGNKAYRFGGPQENRIKELLHIIVK